MILLASSSAARARLLREAGVPFEALPARVDEEAARASLAAAGAAPRDMADALAEMKAARLAAGAPPGLLVMGCDQILSCEGKVYDKPEGLAGARAQLGALRGKSHELHSAAVIFENGAPVWRHVGSARLTMRPFSDRFLDEYLAAEGEAICACVGAYRIEARGAQLFARVAGDNFVIQGMPLIEILGYLRARGILTE